MFEIAMYFTILLIMMKTVLILLISEKSMLTLNFSLSNMHVSNLMYIIKCHSMFRWLAHLLSYSSGMKISYTVSFCCK